jgi:hypothetical protein
MNKAFTVQCNVCMCFLDVYMLCKRPERKTTAQRRKKINEDEIKVEKEKP